MAVDEVYYFGPRYPTSLALARLMGLELNYSGSLAFSQVAPDFRRLPEKASGTQNQNHKPQKQSWMKHLCSVTAKY